MTTLADTEGLITRELTSRGACTLEALAQQLETCTWNQVFMAVDILSRRGTLVLRPLPQFQYMVSLAGGIEHLAPSLPCHGWKMSLGIAAVDQVMNKEAQR
ncbi:MAG: hypothetical protein QM771_18695 [Nitrospira sp.]